MPRCFLNKTKKGNKSGKYVSLCEKINVILHLENLCARVLKGETQENKKQNNISRMKIKNYIYPLLLALVTMTSCLSDQEEEVGNDYCYISNVSLGSLKRTIYTTSTQGEDSTYTVTLDASTFPMSIDLKKRVIENIDSLPYGTRTNAVLVNVTYRGIIAYRQDGDAEWFTYSSSDSINCSAPVEFVVFSTNGLGECHYTLKVNVHKQDGSRFEWNKQADCADLTQLQERKLAFCNGKLVMMGKDANGNVLCATRTTQSNSAWSVTTVSGMDNADINTLQAVGGSALLMNTSEGTLMNSNDGINWTAMTETVAGLKLVGASTGCLYAIADGKLQSSNDNGATWNDEKTDSEGSLLPDGQVNMIQCSQENGYTRLVLMGNNANLTDQKTSVWSKAWNGQTSESNAEWMYYNHTLENNALLSQMSPLFAYAYDKGIVAFGGASNDGQEKALSRMLYSPDFGVTWSNAEYELPSELEGCQDAIASTIDGDNFIWIVAGKQTWCGRLNRMGFKTNK